MPSNCFKIFSVSASTSSGGIASCVTLVAIKGVEAGLPTSLPLLVVANFDLTGIRLIRTSLLKLTRLDDSAEVEIRDPEPNSEPDDLNESDLFKRRFCRFRFLLVTLMGALAMMDSSSTTDIS